MTTNERVIGGHNWCLFQQQQLAAQVEERDATIEQLRADLADRDHDLVIFRRANDDHRTMYRDAVDDAVKLKRDLAERDATIAKWEPTIAKQHDAENPHTHRRGGPPVGHHPIEIHGARIPVRFGKSRPAGQRDPS
ncbi:hypothetical protein [uncultured Mediterranean phage]|nr:hypothetical protein [uncultured Mediterranean phage]